MWCVCVCAYSMTLPHLTHSLTWRRFITNLIQSKKNDEWEFWMNNYYTQIKFVNQMRERKREWESMCGGVVRMPEIKELQIQPKIHSNIIIRDRQREHSQKIIQHLSCRFIPQSAYCIHSAYSVSVYTKSKRYRRCRSVVWIFIFISSRLINFVRDGHCVWL